MSYSFEVTGGSKEAVSALVRQTFAKVVEQQPEHGPDTKLVALLADGYLNMLPPFTGKVTISVKLQGGIETAPIEVQSLYQGEFREDRVYLGGNCSCHVSVKAAGKKKPYRDRIEAETPLPPETDQQRIARLRAEADELEATMKAKE